jgi:hypothetical protein
VGYHLALKVKWKAEKWYRSSWFERMGLPLSFWDEEGMGRVGGLLLKKPLYYDNYRSGTLYREFHSIEEIRSSEANLRSIMAFDDLLSQIPMDLEPGPDRFLTYKKLVLTLWSRQFLDLHPVHEYKALTLTEFKSLHAAILEPATGSDKLTTFQIPASIKESFLMWLKEQSGMPSHDISARLAHVLEALFKEVKDECGNVTQEDLDPHYIRLFAVEQ